MPTSMVPSEILLYCISLTIFFPFCTVLNDFPQIVIIMLHISFPILNVLVFVLNYRELAKELGEKGIILFSDVEHVILKSTYTFIDFMLVFGFFLMLVVVIIVILVCR